MRPLLFVIAASSAAIAAPPAAPPPAPAPAAKPPPGPDDPAALALLDKLSRPAGAAVVKGEVDQLSQLAPRAIDAIGAYLVRDHATSVEDRRKVLEAIKAAVPDKAGRFAAPERKSEKEEKADDDLDWMAGLTGLDAGTPGLGEVIADDAAIRALAATKDPRAAELIFAAGFDPQSIIYRDECGRYLRKMEPYSIPPLLVESQGKDYDRRRYATYQLERLDRQEPGKALAAATGDEQLTLAILDAFRTTHFREAVHAVWSKVNADSPRVRDAARATWMSYITGPAPRPAPRKKLLLPGGKLTKKEKPLWLTYRELADNELRKAANELLGEDYPLADPTLDDSDDDWHKKKTVKVDLEELTKRLFDFYDQQRAKKDADQWAAAKALADKGDLAGATAALDRMLAANPGRPDRTQMVPVYLARAKQLEAKQQWADAAAAYSTAQGLDPTGASAIDALAAHHYALGKALEAQGKDGGPDFRAAIALRPNYAPAKTAEREVEHASRPVWLLYLAASAVAVALALFAAGMMRRRTS
ncbi:MAG TPA: hypothetical protein VLX92_35000 [Kofleriaceae bacterium]|nr:hypothetical protein [Kofleriaceae bacterium]